MELKTLPEELLAAVPAILAAEEDGSATRVAARFGTTTATVLRRLEAAEVALGQRLFERLPTGLEPTAALRAVLPWAQQIASSCDGIQRDLAGLDPLPRGCVRVAVPPTVAGHVLAPHVPALRKRCPNLTIEFDTSTRLADLGHREADIAVRAKPTEEGDLIQRKIGDFRLLVAAAHKLAKRHRTSLHELPWLAWERSQADIQEMRWLHAFVPDATIAFRASELSTLLRAARAGLGAVLAPEPIAAVEGGLVSIPLPGIPPPVGSLYLVTHRALRRVPRVAAVWDWLEETFASIGNDPRARLRPAW